MRELRLSIPFIGGVTAVYTKEEIAVLKQSTLEHVAVVQEKSRLFFNKSMHKAAVTGMMLSSALFSSAAATFIPLIDKYKHSTK